MKVDTEEEVCCCGGQLMVKGVYDVETKEESLIFVCNRCNKAIEINVSAK